MRPNSIVNRFARRFAELGSTAVRLIQAVARSSLPQLGTLPVRVAVYETRNYSLASVPSRRPSAALMVLPIGGATSYHSFEEKGHRQPFQPISG
jgi:hypothetical protein